MTQREQKLTKSLFRHQRAQKEGVPNPIYSIKHITRQPIENNKNDDYTKTAAFSTTYFLGTPTGQYRPD